MYCQSKTVRLRLRCNQLDCQFAGWMTVLLLCRCEVGLQLLRAVRDVERQRGV